MKAKKWLTIITGLISAASLTIALIIGKGSPCILYDIALAIFGSALLGLIMSLTEYFVERRKAMEQFWNEARKVVQQFRNIRYINVDVPHELILACFREERGNSWSKALGSPESDAAKSKLISWLEENVVMSWTEEDYIASELERIFEDRMAFFRREYQRAIDSYVAASAVDVGVLGNSYGNLDFFWNKHIRNKSYSEIYNKLRDFHKVLLSEAYHFNLLTDGSGNFAVCADKAYHICQTVFSDEVKNSDGFTSKVVFQTLFDEIDDSLEWFRCEIYRSEKYKPVERIPVLGVTEAVSFGA